MAKHANRTSRLFQDEFVCEGESISDRDMINRHEYTMSASAPMLSRSTREQYFCSSTKNQPMIMRQSKDRKERKPMSSYSDDTFVPDPHSNSQFPLFQRVFDRSSWTDFQIHRGLTFGKDGRAKANKGKFTWTPRKMRLSRRWHINNPDNVIAFRLVCPKTTFSKLWDEPDGILNLERAFRKFQDSADKEGNWKFRKLSSSDNTWNPESHEIIWN
jgi:hypothetical protein